MLTKTLSAAIVAILLGSTVAATVAEARTNRYSNTWADHSDLGYSTTARHDPRDTNGFGSTTREHSRRYQSLPRDSRTCFAGRHACAANQQQGPGRLSPGPFHCRARS